MESGKSSTSRYRFRNHVVKKIILQERGIMYTERFEEGGIIEIINV